MFAPEQKIRGLALVRMTLRDFGMLKPNPLKRVVKFDIDTQVVRI